MSKLRVLFVDDDEASIWPVRNWAEEKGSFTCSFCNFPELDAKAEDYLPHIVVLDRMKGLSEDRGAPSYEALWGRRFCPVVIYTAYPDEDWMKDKPPRLVKLVKKGSDPGPFEAAMAEIVPFAEILSDAEKYVRDQFACVLRDLAGYVFAEFTESEQIREALLRCGRRRLAALSDVGLTAGSPIAPWEQYVFPPISAHPRLGDVLRVQGGDPLDAASFRVVLTPSCDMIPQGKSESKPKVVLVLAARCCSPKAGFAAVGYANKKPDADRVKSTFLNPGYYQRVVPLPELKGLIPLMMADVKQLELIPWADIGGGDDKYRRVASLDSPFRELISWAFMQDACRLGLPDRDVVSWTEKLLETLSA